MLKTLSPAHMGISAQVFCTVFTHKLKVWLSHQWSMRRWREDWLNPHIICSHQIFYKYCFIRFWGVRWKLGCIQLLLVLIPLQRNNTVKMYVYFKQNVLERCEERRRMKSLETRLVFIFDTTAETSG